MKQIIIGTTTICGEGFWTASYVNNPENCVIGSTVPEAIGCLVSKQLEVTYTDTAREKLEKIQKTTAQIDSVTHLLTNQEEKEVLNKLEIDLSPNAVDEFKAFLNNEGEFEAGKKLLDLSEEIATNFKPES